MVRDQPGRFAAALRRTVHRSLARASTARAKHEMSSLRALLRNAVFMSDVTQRSSIPRSVMIGDATSRRRRRPSSSCHADDPARALERWAEWDDQRALTDSRRVDMKSVWLQEGRIGEQPIGRLRRLVPARSPCIAAQVRAGSITIFLYAGRCVSAPNQRSTFGSFGRSIGSAIQRQMPQPIGMSPIVSASPAR